MRHITIALVALLLSGCSTIELEDKWWPLRFIKESPVIALSAGARTIGDSMYVSNIDKWSDTHPEPYFSGTVTHERVHSIRQKYWPGGRWAWIAKWLTDPAFMLQEEKYGYYYGIRYLQQHGVMIVIDNWAKNLARYVGAAGFMVSEEDAAAWLTEVTQGQWQPPADVQQQIANPGPGS